MVARIQTSPASVRPAASRVDWGRFISLMVQAIPRRVQRSGVGAAVSSQIELDQARGAAASSYSVAKADSPFLTKLKAAASEAAKARRNDSSARLVSPTTSATGSAKTLAAVDNGRQLTELQGGRAIGQQARYVDPASHSGVMSLEEFPRPVGDNGRGMHWIPTLASPPEVVDRFVREAQTMGVKWVVFLNDGANISDNDYLVRKLVGAGIEPILRVYTPEGAPMQGDIRAVVRHYRPMGVRYYQLYNEPNLIGENQGKYPDVNRYLDLWLPAAAAVTEEGGLPGFGALAPGGDFDDIEFLKQALDGIKVRGRTTTLRHAWVSLHNYTLNHPIDYLQDSQAFLKFRWYDSIIRDKLGRSMPIIGTEGGTHIGNAQDARMPAIDEARQVQMVTGAYDYMRRAEPYYFAYTFWVIANEEGGGTDPTFAGHALFQPGYTSPIVDRLKAMA